MENSANIPRLRGRSVSDGASANVGSRRKTKGGSKKKSREEVANPLEIIEGEDSRGIELRVLEVSSGNDIMAAVYDFAKRHQVGISIMSAHGMVSDFTIYQPPIQFQTVPYRTFTDLYHLMSIEGNFYGSPFSIRPPPPFVAQHTVSFTCSQGLYHTGIIHGSLTAVTNVVLGVCIIRGTTAAIRLPLPPTPPRALTNYQPLFPDQNEGMPAEMSGMHELFSGTGMSMKTFDVSAAASPTTFNFLNPMGTGSSTTNFFN